MLTSTDAADVLNLVVMRAQNSLEADAWLRTGGTGGIGLIHPWAACPERVYQAHELPALALKAAEIAPPKGGAPAGTHDLDVLLVVEALEAGADENAVTTTAQSIAARLRQWMADQTISGGNRLDGLLDEGDGALAPGSVRLFAGKPANGTCRATVRAEATVRLRAGA